MGQVEAFSYVRLRLGCSSNRQSAAADEASMIQGSSLSHLNVDRAMREANGITDGLIRVSVGIEDIEDIMADFDQALGSI